MDNTIIIPFPHDCSIHDHSTDGNSPSHDSYAVFSYGIIETNSMESTAYNALLPYVDHHTESHSLHQGPCDQESALSIPGYDLGLALNTPLYFQEAPQSPFTDRENQHSGLLYQDSTNSDSDLSEIWSNASKLSGQTDVSTGNCQKQLSSDPSVRGSKTRLPARKAHDKAEKKYRSNVRDSLAILRDSVPAVRVSNYGSHSTGVAEGRERLRARRLSKTKILSAATEYIRHLEEVNNRLVAEKTGLETTIDVFSHMLPAAM